MTARMADERLREALAALLPDGGPELAEKVAGVAEEYAATLLGGRRPSCARWLPRAGATCGLAAGHLDDCISIAAAVNQRMRSKKRAQMQEATRRRMGGTPIVPRQGGADQSEESAT